MEEAKLYWQGGLESMQLPLGVSFRDRSMADVGDMEPTITIGDDEYRVLSLGMTTPKNGIAEVWNTDRCQHARDQCALFWDALNPALFEDTEVCGVQYSLVRDPDQACHIFRADFLVK